MFTDKHGRKIEAEIVDASKTMVKLKKADGAELEVPFAAFSGEDQDYLARWMEAGGNNPPKWQGGETAVIECPGLPTTRQGGPAAFKIRLPDNYDPLEPMPLLLWFHGGDGGFDPGEGLRVADPLRYAVAAMPYPSTVPAPKDALNEGKMDAIRDYHMAMLVKLFETFPNIDPVVRVAGGFSNGAHTVGTYLTSGEREFIGSFNAFVIIEGGSRAGLARKPLRHRYAYLAWGGTEKGTGPFMQTMLGAVKGARMEWTTREMPDVGHAFPEAEQGAARKWLLEVAEPGLRAKPPA